MNVKKLIFALSILISSASFAVTTEHYLCHDETKSVYEGKESFVFITHLDSTLYIAQSLKSKSWKKLESEYSVSGDRGVDEGGSFNDFRYEGSNHLQIPANMFDARAKKGIVHLSVDNGKDPDRNDYEAPRAGQIECTYVPVGIKLIK